MLQLNKEGKKENLF